MRVSVVQTIAGIAADAGGVARSVPGLCDALASAGCRTILVSQRPRGTPSESLRVPTGAGVETRLVDGYNWHRLRASFTPGLARGIATACRDAAPCVVHDHGMWLHSNHAAASVARRLNVPRVVSPRGMLEDWSLRYHAWKKRLAWRLYQERDLRSASAFCVTADAEMDSLRALGLQQPVAVIPNGISMPAQRARAPRLEPTVLFLSRIHPKKGLLDLVAAWSRSAKRGWVLVIAGPDEVGHRREVEAAAAAAGVSGSIRFTGAVEGAAKQRLFDAADLFVLPSYSENFGIVVAEALAHGVPVITTKATPWSMLAAEKCGWLVATGAEALAAALAEALALSPDERGRMGARGRAWVQRELSWDQVAARHLELYAWLLERGPRPSWLR